MKEMFQRIWNSPNTLVGLSVKAFFGNNNFEKHGDMHFVAKPGSRFDKQFEKMGKTAITLGEIILYKSDAFTRRTIEHEIVHVDQYRKYGPFFLPAYGISSIISRIKHGSWYRENEFEKKARKED
jgi:hypothetical protein